MRWIAPCCALFFAACYASHTREETPARRDGGPPIDAGQDAFVPSFDAWVPPFDAGGPVCELDAPNATISGTTPLGPIDFQYAYAGAGNITHACFEVAIHATDAASVYWGGPARQLYVWIPGHVPTVGVHEDARFTLLFDGELLETTGRVEIYAYSRDAAPPAIEARITIANEGWNVDGTISAPYCGVFSDPCL